MAISIDFQGYEKVLQKIQQYPNNKKRAVKLILEKAAFNIQNNARRILTPQTKQSKNLHQQIQSQPTAEGARVFVKADYGPYVEFGTGGLVNVPRGLEDYAIQFKGRGIRKVNLPARPFMYPAYKEEKPKIAKLVKNACSKP
jgi:HK97 gp10 family phage protein